MTSEVLVDALPYIDQGFDEPGIREAALAMVEEENKRYRPTKNYLEHLPQLNLSAFETDIMKKVSLGLLITILCTILTR
jgi:pre-mRNA-splicing factor SPF27